MNPLLNFDFPYPEDRMTSFNFLCMLILQGYLSYLHFLPLPLYTGKGLPVVSHFSLPQVNILPLQSKFIQLIC